jgi:DNA primase
MEINELYNILLSQDYARKLFSGLSGQRKNGKNNMKADCPFCDGDDFSYSLVEPVYHCWNCDESGDWIDYLQEEEGMGFKEALAYLADEAGVALEISSDFKKEYQEKKSKAKLLETAHQEYFKKNFWKPEGEVVRNYLADRGYSKEDVEAMELGAYTDRGSLVNCLSEKEYSKQDIKRAGLFTGSNEFGFGITHKLTMVWRDQAGRPAGIICRALENEDPKYLYSKGLKKSKGFVGINKSRKESKIILVEGVLDALYLNVKGEPTMSIGGSSLSDSQINALQNAGIKEVILGLDSDKTGQESTEKIIKTLLASELRSYVITLPEEYKDPDEMVRDVGIKAFRRVLEQAKRGVKWLARYMVSRHNIDTDRGIDKAISEAQRTGSLIQDSINKKSFYETLENNLGIPQKDIASRIEKYERRQSQKQAKQVLEKVVNRASNKSSNNDIIGAQKELEQGIKEINKSRGVDTPEPYFVNDFLEDVTQTETGLKTGYKGIDDKLRIPVGAMTFIAGRPGHGKTTMMLNLLVNMLNEYQEKNFYFFSYEEAKWRLSLKLIMNIAGVELHKDQNFRAYINYFKEKKGAKNRIEKALKDFESYTQEGRLFLIDRAMSSDDLASTIHYLAERDDNVGGIFIDYVQKIPSPASHSQRYLEIASVTETLRETTQSLNIPIIAGAQANRESSKGGNSTIIKKEHLRESGDIEQDANLILGIYNKAEAGVDGGDDDRESQKKKVDLKVNVVKGREGGGGSIFHLEFNRPVLKINSRPENNLY